MDGAFGTTKVEGMDMTAIQASEAGARPGNRRFWIALFVAVVGLCCIAGGSAPKAMATEQAFCNGVWLAAYGNVPNDRCTGPAYPQYITRVSSLGQYHSSCADAIYYPGSYEGLVTSWACAPTGAWSNVYFDGSRLLGGIIRNNVLNDTNYEYGVIAYP
jgi:hypothetical protein